MRIAGNEEVIQLVKNSGIFLEMCPTSNRQTRAVEDMFSYPLKNFLEQGLKVTLNTDDPAIERTTLSHEFQYMDSLLNLTAVSYTHLCCFCVFYLRNTEGLPFSSALAVLQCIQPSQDSMAQVAKKRVTGTVVGAFWGLVIILIQMYLFHGSLMDTFPGYMLISLFTGIVIYSTVVLNCKNTAYFSCVVFLSITAVSYTHLDVYKRQEL